jgi:hypothetical protein
VSNTISDLRNYVAGSNLGLTIAYLISVVLDVISDFKEYVCGALKCVTIYSTAISTSDISIIDESDRPIDNEFNKELPLDLKIRLASL